MDWYSTTVQYSTDWTALIQGLIILLKVSCMNTGVVGASLEILEGQEPPPGVAALFVRILIIC